RPACSRASVPAQFRERAVRPRRHAREREGQGRREESRKGAPGYSRPPDAARTDLPEEQVHARRRVLDARRRDRTALVASGSLRHRTVEERCAADEVRRAYFQPSGLYRSADAVGKGDAPLSLRLASGVARGVWFARLPGERTVDARDFHEAVPAAGAVRMVYR